MSQEPLFQNDNEANNEQDRLLPHNAEDNVNHQKLNHSQYSAISSEKKESPTPLGTATFIKSLIGTGVLALPYVINAVGVGPAWILLIGIGFLNLYVMQLVNEVANDLGIVKVDFGRLALVLTGKKWFRYFSEANLLVVQLGSVIAAVVFISKYLEVISCALGWSWLCSHYLIQYAVILGFILPASGITDLHYLAIPNVIALGFQLAFFIVFCVTSIQLMATQGVSHGGFKESLHRFDLSELPVAFATILYAYEGVGLMLEVRTSVGGGNKFDMVLFLAFTASMILYSFFGSVGALAYGDNAQSVIFLSMDSTNQLILLVQFGYLLAIIIGAPSILYSASRLIENYKIFNKWIVDKKTGKKSKIKRQLVRLPIVLVICAIAAVIPSFGSFLSLLGGCNFVILCFVLPVVFYYFRFRGDPTRKQKFIVNWIIMGVGIVLGAIAVVQSIDNMVEGDNSVAD